MAKYNAVDMFHIQITCKLSWTQLACETCSWAAQKHRQRYLRVSTCSRYLQIDDAIGISRSRLFYNMYVCIYINDKYTFRDHSDNFDEIIAFCPYHYQTLDIFISHSYRQLFMNNWDRSTHWCVGTYIIAIFIFCSLTSFSIINAS